MKNNKGKNKMNKATLKKHSLVWLKQNDYNKETWTLGIVQGVRKKTIICEDLARPEIKQTKLKKGYFLPKNVRLLTEEELKNNYYTDKQKEIIERDAKKTLPAWCYIMEKMENA